MQLPAEVEYHPLLDLLNSMSTKVAREKHENGKPAQESLPLDLKPLEI
jgi:hypothetical protein